MNVFESTCDESQAAALVMPIGCQCTEREDESERAIAVSGLVVVCPCACMQAEFNSVVDKENRNIPGAFNLVKCHCSDCRRFSPNGVVWLGVENKSVVIRGQNSISALGARRFCKNCGCPLYMAYPDDLPDCNNLSFHEP